MRGPGFGRRRVDLRLTKLLVAARKTLWYPGYSVQQTRLLYDRQQIKQDPRSSSELNGWQPLEQFAGWHFHLTFACFNGLSINGLLYYQCRILTLFREIRSKLLLTKMSRKSGRCNVRVNAYSFGNINQPMNVPLSFKLTKQKAFIDLKITRKMSNRLNYLKIAQDVIFMRLP